MNAAFVCLPLLECFHFNSDCVHASQSELKEWKVYNLCMHAKREREQERLTMVLK